MAEYYGFPGAKQPAQGPVSGSFQPESKTEVKTTVYTPGSSTTESGTDYSQKARDVGEEAASQARHSLGGLSQSAQETKEGMKEGAYNAKETLHEKWEEGKEKAGQAYEAAKEKVQYASEVAGEKYQQTKERAAENLEAGKERLGETYDAAKVKTSEAAVSAKEGSHGLMDRVKETAGNTANVIQQKSHDFVEQAQHTLEAAREKAREVFAGAQSETTKETMYVKPGETAYTGTENVDVKVKTDAPGDIDRVKVQTTTTTQ